ncbi:MAG TPA: SIMPL domain-containing protein, partial [Candidatus Paceibacterota bacterium]|nr:SIMPL domain-containing protein [Candidatus Paceibacterota bacterium]
MESTSIFRTTYIKVLTALFLASATLAVLAYAAFAYQQAKHWQTGPMIINVSGEGEVMARPDIGSFNFGVRAEAETAAAAQEQSATAMNDIIGYLAEAGVAEADIDTSNYTLNPRYRWVEEVCVPGTLCRGGERVIDGYEVSQTVSVKVRDLEQSGALISGVGQRGATNVSSLQFTIDDPANLEAEARSLAIADAQAKAEVLAAELGVSIVEMTGFYEENQGRPIEPYLMARSEMAMDGMGGATAPSVPVG